MPKVNVGFRSVDFLFQFFLIVDLVKDGDAVLNSSSAVAVVFFLELGEGSVAAAMYEFATV